MRTKFLMLLAVVIAIGWSTVEARKLNYSFDPPKKPWEKAKATNADFAYRHSPSNSGIIIGSRCEEGAADPPLEILFRHLFIDFENQEIASQSKIELDGKEALKTELAADYGGEHLKFLSVIVKQKACVYDILLIARPAKFGEVKDDFERLLNSFKFK